MSKAKDGGGNRVVQQQIIALRLVRRIRSEKNSKSAKKRLEIDEEEIRDLITEYFGANFVNTFFLFPQQKIRF